MGWMEPEVKSCRSAHRLLDEESDLVKVIVMLRDPEIHTLVELVDTRWRPLGIRQSNVSVTMPDRCDRGLRKEIEIPMPHTIERIHQRSGRDAKYLHRRARGFE